MQNHYKDRRDGGSALARALEGYAGEKAVVAGLPRGGVVTAAEVAGKIGGELDVVIAGKLRAPGNPELAIGAINETGEAWVNERVAESLGVSPGELEKEKASRLSVVKSRAERYRKIRPKVALRDRTVILVDDGLATGSTMIAAVLAARAEGAGKVIVAVPGGPSDTVELLEGMDKVDEVVCPAQPSPFYAVSQIYDEFGQVSDDEVEEILRREAAGA